MAAPRTKPPAIHGRLTPKVLPPWLRNAEKLQDLTLVADLLNDARPVPSLVWNEPHAAVFRLIAEGARAESSRLGVGTLPGKRVVYEVCALAPGFLEPEAQALPIYRWIVEEWSAIAQDLARIENSLPRRRGPPEERDTPPVLFALFRARGLTRPEAIAAVASLEHRSAEGIKSALKRAARESGAVAEVNASVGLCRCRRTFPYCNQCGFWFRPSAAPSDSGPALRPLTEAEHRCVGPLELASVHTFVRFCRRCSVAQVPFRVKERPEECRCPRCKSLEFTLRERYLPHRHCIVCGRPHPQHSPAPILAAVEHGKWSCADTFRLDGCRTAARALLSRSP